MNQIAEMFGYTGPKEKISLKQKRQEEAVERVVNTCNNIMEKLATNENERKSLENTLGKFIKKYSDQLLSGDYALITGDTLIVMGTGNIVEEEQGIIVWTPEKFIDWDDMESIVEESE